MLISDREFIGQKWAVRRCDYIPQKQADTLLCACT